MPETERINPPSSASTASIIIIGTVAVSSAAPFIKLAGMHPLTLTAGRLLGVALLYALVGRDFIAQWRGLTRPERRRLLLGMPLLAGHFACWITAFNFTDLPSAVLLLVLQPLIASWFGARVFRERVTRGILITMTLALAGLALITFDDLRMSQRHLIGDALVAVGAVFIISFMSVGKNLRPRLSFSAWMTLAYGGAGVWAAAGVFIMKAPIVGYPAESYGWLVALIIITTGIGHAALNYVLPYVRLFTVNLATVAEPVIAIGASMLFLAETVTSAEVIGGGLLTAAMFVGMRDEWKPRRELPELETG